MNRNGWLHVLMAAALCAGCQKLAGITDTTVGGGDGGAGDASIPDLCATTPCAWSQVDHILAVNAGAADRFGSAVATSGSVVVIGSPGNDGGGSDRGAAFVFEKVGGAWTLAAALAASDTADGDVFGASVAVDGDVIAVGAISEDGAAANSGAAYVFERIDGQWAQTAKLTAPDAVQGALLGYSVAVSGDVVAVAATDDGINRQGAVYVFERVGLEWPLAAKLVPADIRPESYFGESLALDGDLLIGTAPEFGSGFGRKVFAFERAGDAWAETESIPRPSGITAADRFGTGVAASGDRVIVGVDPDASPAAAPAFDRAGSSWQESPPLAAAGVVLADRFARKVALDGDTAFVTAPGDQDDSGDFGTIGAVYVFEHRAGEWVEADKLTAARNDSDEGFGFALATRAGVLIVGAPFDDRAAADGGSAYVFELRPTSP